MRRIFLVSLLILWSGCDRSHPRMAGGKCAEAMGDPDAKVRRKAAFTLGNIGPSDPAALPALIAALKDVDAGVRCETIMALVKFGAGAKEAIPVLSEIRERDRDAGVRTCASRALEKLRGGK